MTAMAVSWQRCEGGVWCQLERIDLDGPYFRSTKVRGVYLIWHAGPAPNVVYVGQGNIADRLRHHRQDPQILSYRSCGHLYVTWALLSDYHLDGVEQFLANTFSPLVGYHSSNSNPIAVTLPE